MLAYRGGVTTANSTPVSPLNLDNIDAILFDLDGVITPTAEVHMHAWSRMFNQVLVDYEGQTPYTDADYFQYVDGKPRYDGVQSFLTSRGIELPYGEPTDAPAAATICGLGNRKNDLVLTILEEEGVDPYPGSIAFLDSLPTHVRIAIVSSSKNAPVVLKAAGVFERFETVVDGNVAAEKQIAGKPEPDTYVYGATLLETTPARSIVVEDATSGVEAGAAGAFAQVIGVNRGVGHDALRAAGATIVVDDLEELA